MRQNPVAGEDQVKVIAVPEQMEIKDHNFIRILTFGDAVVFHSDKGVFSENTKLAIPSIKGKKVVNFVLKDHVRCYVTEDGRLHYQGLVDKLAEQAGEVNLENLSGFDALARLQGFERGDKIVDCHIGGDGS